MTAAGRSLATAPWRARVASGLLPTSYTTARDTTPTKLVSSNESHSIEQFDAKGNWLGTFASTGPWTPHGIASNALGDVYVATFSNTILRFKKSGKPFSSGFAFTLPGGNPLVSVIFDSLGNLYAVTKYGAAGSVVTIYKFTPAQLALAAPVGTVLVNTTLGRADQMAFDTSGHLCVADFLDPNTVQCFNTATGALAVDYATEIPSGAQPNGLAFDSANRLIESETRTDKVRREPRARTGPLQTLASGLTPDLYYLAQDSGGFIYVTSWHGVNARFNSCKWYACNDSDFSPDVIYKIDPVSGAATKFIDSHVWGPYQMIFFSIVIPRH